LLVAQDELTNEQIAERVGVARYSLDRWKLAPEFRSRVASLVADMREAVRQRGIADKRNRLDLYEDIKDRLRQVVAERAADPTMADVPGGRTGMLVRGYKSIGSGESAQRVEEYTVDGVLAKELRDYAKQAAIEVGDWAERRELTGKDGAAIAVDLNLKALTDEELVRLEQLTRKATDPS
jgi:hypothetical protein